MNNISIRLPLLETGDIGALLNAGVCPDDVAQELTDLLNASMPAGVTIEVCSIQGHEVYIQMRDAMTGAQMEGEEVLLDDLDDLRGDAQQLLGELEEMAATVDVGLRFVPFAQRTPKVNRRVLLEALQGQAGAGVFEVGTTHGVTIYRLPGSYPGLLVGIEVSEAHAWTNVLDEHVNVISALRTGQPALTTRA